MRECELAVVDVAHQAVDVAAVGDAEHADGGGREGAVDVGAGHDVDGQGVETAGLEAVRVAAACHRRPAGRRIGNALGHRIGSGEAERDRGKHHRRQSPSKRETTRDTRQSFGAVLPASSSRPQIASVPIGKDRPGRRAADVLMFGSPCHRTSVALDRILRAPLPAFTDLRRIAFRDYARFRCVKMSTLRVLPPLG